MQQFDNVFERFRQLLKFPKVVTFESFSSADDALNVTEELTDREIVVQVQRDLGVDQPGLEQDGDVDVAEDEVDDTGPEPRVPTTSEALAALDMLKLFFQNQSDKQTTIDSLVNMEDQLSRIVLAAKKQKKITDFFS